MDAFYFRRALRSSFQPIINFENPELELKKAVAESMIFDAGLTLWSQQEISSDDFLDIVEVLIPNMDSYLDEVAANLDDAGLPAAA
jgi:hypothetical protein